MTKDEVIKTFVGSDVQKCWKIPPTDAEIRKVERQCGAVAQDLAELAQIVLEAARVIDSDEPKSSAEQARKFRERIFASIRLLRPEVEKAVGVHQGVAFYKDFVSALTYYDNYGNFQWGDKKNEADTIAEILGEMHTRNKPSPSEQKKYTKAPSKTAIQAYLTLKSLGCSQDDVAQIMTKKIKPKKPYQQYQISRWKIACEKWLKENNLNVFPSDTTPQITTVDPAKLDVGARTDSKVTGDPLHKAKYDDDEYDD